MIRIMLFSREIKRVTTLDLVPNNLKSGIPRNTFRTYKTNSFNYSHHERLSNFISSNAGWNHYFYLNQDVEHYMYQNWRNRTIYEIFRKIISWPAKIDIWRLCILYQYGGFYLDIDSDVFVPLDSLCDGRLGTLSFEGNSLRDLLNVERYPEDLELVHLAESYPDQEIHIVLNWAMGFSVENEFLDKCIMDIENKFKNYANRGKVESVWGNVIRFTGPLMLTRIYFQNENYWSQRKVFASEVDFGGKAQFCMPEVKFKQKREYYKNQNETNLFEEVAN